MLIVCLLSIEKEKDRSQSNESSQKKRKNRLSRPSFYFSLFFSYVSSTPVSLLIYFLIKNQSNHKTKREKRKSLKSFN